MRRLLIICVALVLAGALASRSPAGASDGCSYKTKEKAFMRKFNQKRENNGVAKLTWDLSLARVARHHTGKMVARNDVFHSGENQNPYGVHSVGVHLTNWVEIGEIVGRGQTVGSLVDAFMDSSRHRAIILDPDWKYMGAGTESTNTNYPLYVTGLFEREANPGTTFHSC